MRRKSLRLQRFCGIIQAHKNAPVALLTTATGSMGTEVPQRMTYCNAPVGYCQCGCGQITGIWQYSDQSRGRVKGEHKQFVRGHNGRIHSPEYYAPRSCSDCDALISRTNKTGLCVRCQMAEVGRANAKPKPCCAHCGNVCSVVGQKFCSRECYLKGNTRPTGPAHHSWRGDQVGNWGARRRAQKVVPSGNCEVCGQPGADRHHIDRNILNNNPTNIAYLCRSHHAQLHYEEDGPRGFMAQVVKNGD